MAYRKQPELQSIWNVSSERARRCEEPDRRGTVIARQTNKVIQQDSFLCTLCLSILSDELLEHVALGFQTQSHCHLPPPRSMSNVRRDDSDSFACLTRNLAYWSHCITFLSSQHRVIMQGFALQNSTKRCFTLSVLGRLKPRFLMMQCAYSTILVDLDKYVPIALLKDASVESLATRYHLKVFTLLLIDTPPLRTRNAKG